MPDADWVSLTVRGARNSYLTLAATGDVARRAEELQYAMRQGPCVAAAGGSKWYRSGSVEEDDRWPRWGPQAAGLGIRSRLSVRLAADEDAPIGALNIYSSQFNIKLADVAADIVATRTLPAGSGADDTEAARPAAARTPCRQSLSRGAAATRDKVCARLDVSAWLKKTARLERSGKDQP